MDERIPSRQKPIEHYIRRESAGRRLGADAQCACGETRAQALVRGSKPVTCKRCRRTSQGRTTVDLHHFAGCANDPTTIPVSVNDHVADLTERQQEWPTETLENPTGDPLRRAAACVRGFRDTLYSLMDRAVFWIAGMLELLSDFLIAKDGPRWFVGTPLEQFARPRKEE
jgi:hypothetical protein